MNFLKKADATHVFFSGTDSDMSAENFSELREMVGNDTQLVIHLPEKSEICLRLLAVICNFARDIANGTKFVLLCDAGTATSLQTLRIVSFFPGLQLRTES